MRPKVVLSMLIACATPVLLHAAEDPTKSTLLKQCESAQGEVKAECKEVAKQMMQHPEQQEQRTDTSSQDVTHSSPAMHTDPKPAKPAAKPTPPTQDAKRDAEKQAEKVPPKP
ncbi:MAG: hypothetical protein SXG53_12385 [Pseudomonadota bacterium]|nr:hypothetical protein [Pseudomonadota bacterium]